MSDEKKKLDLSEREREVLVSGLHEWGGPCSMTDDLARAIAFPSADDFYTDRGRLLLALREGEPLSDDDWHRVIAATEIAFISDVVGSGRDWSICTGFRDDETLALIRGIQDELRGCRRR
jgi:hypothetical protein